ncbi:MAG: hypothetical protein OXC40_02815 [Proteobacteria bacterium]|nr:hypothetical protein [Pseudomonadota bacterium]
MVQAKNILLSLLLILSLTSDFWLIEASLATPTNNSLSQATDQILADILEQEILVNSSQELAWISGLSGLTGYRRLSVTAYLANIPRSFWLPVIGAVMVWLYHKSLAEQLPLNTDINLLEAILKIISEEESGSEYDERLSEALLSENMTSHPLPPGDHMLPIPLPNKRSYHLHDLLDRDDLFRAWYDELSTHLTERELLYQYRLVLRYLTKSHRQTLPAISVHQNHVELISTLAQLDVVAQELLLEELRLTPNQIFPAPEQSSGFHHELKSHTDFIDNYLLISSRLIEHSHLEHSYFITELLKILRIAFARDNVMGGKQIARDLIIDLLAAEKKLLITSPQVNPYFPVIILKPHQASLYLQDLRIALDNLDKKLQDYSIARGAITPYLTYHLLPKLKALEKFLQSDEGRAALGSGIVLDSNKSHSMTTEIFRELMAKLMNYQKNLEHHAQP